MRQATPDEFVTHGLAITHIPTGTRYSTYRYSDPKDVQLTMASLGHEVMDNGDEYDPDQVKAVALDILRAAVAAGD